MTDRLRASCLPLALLIVGWVFYRTAVRPEHNWDILPYIACAEELRGGTPEEIHARAFDALRAGVDEERFNALIGTAKPEGYRARIYASPDALMEQLQFYRVRVAYVRLLRGLMDLGFPAVAAIHAISLLACALALFLGERALASRGIPREWRAAFVALAPALGMISVARQGTPDALAWLWIMAWLNAYARGRPYAPWILATSALIRTDLALFALLLLAAQAFADRARWQTAFACGLVLSASYAAIHAWSGNVGWSATVFVSLIAPNAFPISRPVGISVAQYFQLLKMAGVDALADFRMGALVLAAVATWRLEARWKACVLAATVYAVVRLLLFPALWERFFLPAFTIALAATTLLAHNHSESLKKDRRRLPVL